MQPLYHAVPEQMNGNKLIPLNQMRFSNPTLHAEYLRKYKGRQEVLQRTIPLLDCLWNDVVQFLPLHPEKVFGLQIQLGLIPKIPAYQFFEIDLAALNPDKTVVYFKTAAGEENTEIKWLRDVDITTIQEIPKATLNYYQSLVDTGELPFNYQFIPHVLHKGNVDISNSPVVTLK